jgi:phospholipase/lecithinase/hemolysin
MRKTKFALALLTAAALTACGGNGSRGGDQTLKTKFSSQVTFGDSLADVGTYNVGAIKAAGGGEFTINGDNTAVNPELTGKNFTQLIAAQLGLPAPCAAQTGLLGPDSSDPTKDFFVPVVDHPECFGYAQGGARVTNPIGPNNKALDPTGIGALTVPVVTQVANHLAKVGGKFKGDEVVIVMAGGNDALEQLGELSAAATAAGTKAGSTTFATSLTQQLAAGAPNPATAAQSIGLAIQTEAAKGSSSDLIVKAAVTAAVVAGNTNAGSPTVYGPMVTKAQADAAAAGAKAGADFAAADGPNRVKALATAGAELAALVNTQIVGKGANYVVVNNLPDVSISPSAKAQSAETQALIKAMVAAFNDTLKASLGASDKVLYVDVAAISHDQATNPAPYGLTNTTTPACAAAGNILGGSSLVCNKNNLISGDVSHYMFADSVHPTPFEYSLLARYVAEQMIVKGWL